MQATAQSLPMITQIILSALPYRQQRSTWNYDYDIQGNITCVTDPQGNKTPYTFDKMNRLAKTTLTILINIVLLCHIALLLQV